MEAEFFYKGSSGNLPARLIETFESLGLLYETDSARQEPGFPTSDQRALIAALIAGEALFQKNDEGPWDGQADARINPGVSYTTSLTDLDGQHYRVQWVFNQLEQLLWVQAIPTLNQPI